MTYIHHIRTDAQSIERLRHFIETYEEDHPNTIKVHGAGHLGKSYLVYASVDLSEPLQTQEFDTWMCAVKQSL